MTDSVNRRSAGLAGLPTPVRLAYLLLLLFGFLVAIQLMGSSFKMMGSGAVKGEGSMLTGIENPFAGLAVGVLATVLVQSSSTTTSVIVTLVGSGVLPLGSAVPMIMGANIGTTVTNTLVSLGHVRASDDFKRAFAAATVHDFFNVLCVIIMLPLEIKTHFLQRSATWMTDRLGMGGGVEYKSPIKTAVKTVAGWVKDLLEATQLSGTALAIAVLIVGIAATFFCLVNVTKTMRSLIAGRIEKAMNGVLEKSGLVGIVIGIIVTVLVQSSSVTTSLLVPMCAAGILPLRHAFPIMLGANLGTTVTALLASMAVDNPAGLTIAIVHVMFNGAGILMFYPFPVLRQFPARCAEALASAAIRNRLWIVIYVVGVFVVLPLVGWKLLG